MAAQGAALPSLPAGPRVPIPQVYTFLNGGLFVTDVNITVEDAIKQVLHWIGFRTEDARNALVNDDFGSYDDVKVLTEKDISTMATNFSGRTGASGRMYFGTRRIKVHSTGRTGAATKVRFHSANFFFRNYLHIVVRSKIIVYERIASVFCAESNPV